jgi:biotin synthase
MTQLEGLIDQATAGDRLSNQQIAELFEVPVFTSASAEIQLAARAMSDRACNSKAEVHAQFGLNVAPCPRNCMFCSFAAANGVFEESSQSPVEQVVSDALRFEADGANAIYLMATADYAFQHYLEVAREVRRSLAPQSVLVANVGDFDEKAAGRLVDAGFAGIYHAVRLGEGRDTKLDPARRLETIKHARRVGLAIGTCLEPVGPEHATAELVEKTVITRDAGAVFSGAARRIPIPGTQLARRGIVSEARMAHILAVVRLAVGPEVPGNCTHEPSVIGSAAGATLLWAEVGSNPRDAHAQTRGRRGWSVADCRRVLQEAHWDVLEGPSAMFAKRR